MYAIKCTWHRLVSPYKNLKMMFLQTTICYLAIEPPNCQESCDIHLETQEHIFLCPIDTVHLLHEAT